MTERRGMLLVVAVVAVLVIAGFGGGFTLARMSDTETKQVSVSAGTWTTTPGTPTSPEHAISFAAFCTADETDASASAVAITNVVRDDEGEPFGITYESDVDLSTVVLKGGQTVENFPGGTGDTIYFGNGTAGADDQTPPEPCPNGETLLVKFEYDDDTDSFVPEIETQASAATGNSEKRSPTNTASATETNDSTEATPSTPSETTAETVSMAAETTVTTETSTATASPTSTETGTTAGPAVTADNQTGQTNGNETTGATTDV